MARRQYEYVLDVAKRKRRRNRSDVFTAAAIYGAAVLATVGFLVASVIDQVLRQRAKQ